MCFINEKTILILLGAALTGQSFADNKRDEVLREMGAALAAGSCNIVLQKQYETTGTRTVGTYLADNSKLHQCQYVLEISSNSCVKAKS